MRPISRLAVVLLALVLVLGPLVLRADFGAPVAAQDSTSEPMPTEAVADAAAVTVPAGAPSDPEITVDATSEEPPTAAAAPTEASDPAAVSDAVATETSPDGDGVARQADLANGSVMLLVRDENDAPVLGTCWSLSTANEYGGPIETSPVQSCDAADGSNDGQLTRQELAPGNYVFMQEYTGGTYMHVFSVPFTVVAGGATLATAYVYSSVLAMVTSFDQFGDPVPGACYDLWTQTGWNSYWHTGVECDADNDGGVAFDEIYVGRTYEVRQTTTPFGYSKAANGSLTMDGRTGSATIVTPKLAVITARPTATASATATATSTASPAPSSSATRTPTPEPTATSTPKSELSRSPSSGTVGRTVVVMIAKFPVNTRVAIYFDAGRKLTLTTDASGAASGSFAVPAATSGKHTIKANGGGRSAAVSFTVKPRVKLSPMAVQAGKGFTATFTGFAPSSAVKLRLYDVNGSSTVVSVWTATTDEAGSATASVTTKSATKPGAHALVATDASGNTAQTTLNTTAAPTPTPTPAPTIRVAVSVGCYGNPERTTITNQSSVAIVVLTVGSLYQPRSGEPYGVNQRLAAGQSITYQTGAAASGNVLTYQYIYNNDVGSTEGARVVTDHGTFAARC